MRRRAFGLAVVVPLLLAVACGGGGPTDEESRLIDEGLRPEPAASFPVGTPAKTPSPEEVFSDPIDGVRTVSLPSKDDTRLVGVLFGDEQTREKGVVLVHRDGNRKGEWFPFALELMERGYAALAIDLRGHGQSEGKPDETKYPQDVQAALDILYVNDVNHAAVIGVQEGGTAAIAAIPSWGGPLEAAIAIDAEPTFEDLDATDAAGKVDIPVMVAGERTSFADLIDTATVSRVTQDPERRKDGAIVDAMLAFLDEQLG